MLGSRKYRFSDGEIGNIEVDSNLGLKIVNDIAKASRMKVGPPLSDRLEHSGQKLERAHRFISFDSDLLIGGPVDWVIHPISIDRVHSGPTNALAFRYALRDPRKDAPPPEPVAAFPSTSLIEMMDGYIPWSPGDEVPKGLHGVLVVRPGQDPFFDFMTYGASGWQCLSGYEDGPFVKAYKAVNHQGNVRSVWSAVQKQKHLTQLKNRKGRLDEHLKEQQEEMDATLKDLLQLTMEIDAIEKGL